MLYYISNSAHYKEVLSRVLHVKESLWIGTADIKDLYIEYSCIFAAFISKIKERNMKVSLDIRVFNWLLSVDIKKSRIAEYEKAAYHAWDRYRLYNKYYKDCKTEHQIALMTMLDISVHPFINYWSKDEEKVTIELPVFDEMLTVTVNVRGCCSFYNQTLFLVL